jgi:predicted RecB family nuclease
VPVEKIDGIGPSRAELLRQRGIKTVEAFRKTPAKNLRELLGDLAIGEMKKQSTKLINEARRRARIQERYGEVFPMRGVNLTVPRRSLTGGVES